MLKYSLCLTLAIALAACGGDNGTDDQMPPEAQDMEDMEQLPSPEGGADIDVSDEELEEFVDGAMKAQEVQMGYQQDMMEILEAEGLDPQVFSQIFQAQEMGQDPGEAGISDEDLERYENVDASIGEIEAEMEAEMDELFAEEGIDMDRFEEINMALQQDPELQQRVQQLMQEQGMGAPEGQQPQQQQPEQQPQPDEQF